MYDQTFQRAFKRAVNKQASAKPHRTPSATRSRHAPQRLRHSNRAGSARPFRRLYDDVTRMLKLAVPVRSLMRCRPSLIEVGGMPVNPGGFTTPARRHRCRIERPVAESLLRPLMAGNLSSA